MSFWGWGSSNNQDAKLDLILTKLDQINNKIDHWQTSKTNDLPYTPCQTPALPNKAEFNKELAEKIKTLRMNMGESHGF
jgi:hypothetical protein